MKTLVSALKQKSYEGKFVKNFTHDCEVKASMMENNGKKEYFLTLKFVDYTIIDDADDLVLKGAVTESFEKVNGNRKVAFCWQHDTKDPIGTIIDFWEDDKGGYVKVKLSDFDVVPNAKRAYYQSVDGTLNQASFGYRYVWEACKWIDKEESDRGRGYFACGKLKTFEVSIVTLGCNPETEVISTEVSEKEFIVNTLKELHGIEELEIKGEKPIEYKSLAERMQFVPKQGEYKSLAERMCSIKK